MPSACPNKVSTPTPMLHWDLNGKKGIREMQKEKLIFSVVSTRSTGHWGLLAT